MKKALAVSLALIMIFTCCMLAACDKNNSTQSATTQTTSNTDNSTSTPSDNSTQATITCYVCHKVLTHYNKTDVGYFCDDCYKESYGEIHNYCYSCNTEAETLYSTGDNFQVCLDCFYEHTQYCSHCDNFVLHYTTIGDDIYCDNCSQQ